MAPTVNAITPSSPAPPPASCAGPAHLEFCAAARRSPRSRRAVPPRRIGGPSTSERVGAPSPGFLGFAAFASLLNASEKEPRRRRRRPPPHDRRARCSGGQRAPATLRRARAAGDPSRLNAAAHETWLAAQQRTNRLRARIGGAKRGVADGLQMKKQSCRSDAVVSCMAHSVAALDHELGAGVEDELLGHGVADRIARRDGGLRAPRAAGLPANSPAGGRRCRTACSRDCRSRRAPRWRTRKWDRSTAQPITPADAGRRRLGGRRQPPQPLSSSSAPTPRRPSPSRRWRARTVALPRGADDRDEHDGQSLREDKRRRLERRGQTPPAGGSYERPQYLSMQQQRSHASRGERRAEGPGGGGRRAATRRRRPGAGAGGGAERGGPREGAKGPAAAAAAAGGPRRLRRRRCRSRRVAFDVESAASRGCRVASRPSTGTRPLARSRPVATARAATGARLGRPASTEASALLGARSDAALGTRARSPPTRPPPRRPPPRTTNEAARGRRRRPSVAARRVREVVAGRLREAVRSREIVGGACRRWDWACLPTLCAARPRTPRRRPHCRSRSRRARRAAPCSRGRRRSGKARAAAGAAAAGAGQDRMPTCSSTSSGAATTPTGHYLTAPPPTPGVRRAERPGRRRRRRWRRRRRRRRRRRADRGRPRARAARRRRAASRGAIVPSVAEPSVTAPPPSSCRRGPPRTRGRRGRRTSRASRPAADADADLDVGFPPPLNSPTSPKASHGSMAHGLGVGVRA